MYRFNGHDSRLERMLESTVMVMEAFEGHSERLKVTNFNPALCQILKVHS